MATKSILEIDVNDEAFRRFKDLFDKYTASLDDAPGKWAATGREIGETGMLLSRIAEATEATVSGIGMLITRQAEQTEETKKTASQWSHIASASHRVAVSVKDTTLSLLRWASLGSIFSGLLGGGALLGLDRLASIAASGSRSAGGLGTGFGALRAFGVDFGQTIDPRGFLAGVNEALHDVTKRVGLYAAGLQEPDLAGRDTASVGAALLDQLKRIADQTPDALLSQVMQARQLDQFVSLEDFERIKHMTPDELRAYQRGFTQDRRALDLTRDQQSAWTQFRVQLTRAGESIETTLIRGLTNLTGPLSHLSSSLEHLLATVLASPVLQDGIEKLGHGIDWLASYIASPQFQTDMEEFGTRVEKATIALGGMIDWLFRRLGIEDAVPEQRYAEPFGAPPIDQGGPPAAPSPEPEDHGWFTPYHAKGHWEGFTWVPDAATPASPPEPQMREPWSAPQADPGAAIPFTNLPGGRLRRQMGIPRVDAGALFQNAAFRPQEFARQDGYDGSGSYGAGDGYGAASARNFGGIEARYGLPPGLLDSIWDIETSRGQGALVSSAGAMGDFQFMPDTARQYGLTNLFDRQQSADAAGRMFRDLLRDFDGDVPAAAASYNAGEGRVKDDMRRYGADWRQHLPAETQRYLDKLTQHMAVASRPSATPTLTVRIENATGGNAIVTTQQLAI